jgi:hypothetical protein
MLFLRNILRGALAGALLAGGAAHAGRPMVADDAAIVPAGECQVEAWREHHPGNTQYWAAPHCNFGGNWELIAGAGSLDPGPSRGSTGALLAAKTVFRELKPNDWALGLSLADQVAPGGAGSTVAISVPLTLSLLDDRLHIDLNGGWMHQRRFRTGATWAAGAEWSASDRIGLTLETYGFGRAYAQAGLRVVTLDGKVVLDAALGDRLALSGKERYFALGLTISGLALR